MKSPIILRLLFSSFLWMNLSLPSIAATESGTLELHFYATVSKPTCSIYQDSVQFDLGEVIVNMSTGTIVDSPDSAITSLTVICQGMTSLTAKINDESIISGSDNIIQGMIDSSQSNLGVQVALDGDFENILSSTPLDVTLANSKYIYLFARYQMFSSGTYGVTPGPFSATTTLTLSYL